MNLPGWGSLRLALPLSGDSDASYLAAEAVAAAAAPAGAPPSAGTGAVNDADVGTAQARRQQGDDRDGRAAERDRPRRRAGSRRRHHRAAAVSARSLAVRREERGGLLAPAGPDRDRRLSDGSAQGHLAVAGTGHRRQRVLPVPAQARTTRRTRQARLPHRRRRDAEERRDELRAGFGSPVGRRLRDAGHPGQRADRAVGQPGRHDHARPVDDRPGGRQDPARQRGGGARRASADDAADGGGRAVDVRRCRRAIRGRRPVHCRTLSTASPARPHLPRRWTGRPHRVAARCRSPRCD